MEGERIEMTTFNKSVGDPEADPERIDSNEKNKELGEKVEKKLAYVHFFCMFPC